MRSNSSVLIVSAPYEEAAPVDGKGERGTPTNKKLRAQSDHEVQPCARRNHRAIRAIPFLRSAGSSLPRSWSAPPRRWPRLKQTLKGSPIRQSKSGS